MSTIKLWGRKSIANVQKVTWCLGELAIPYVHEEDSPPRSEPWDAEYETQKGAGVVPLIEEEDGFILWEGNAIARYLAQKFGRGTLWPDDARARADAERWMDYQLSTARVHIHPLMRETPSPDEVAYHSRMLAKVMTVAEKALATRDYLAGAEFTVGDIPLGIVTYRWFVLDIERPPMPNIEAWFERLEGRPAFRRHVSPPEGAFTPLRRAAGSV